MKKPFLEVSLPVSIFKEGKNFVVYTPALDLSTSGKNFEEAKKRFHEVVTLFIEETIKKGTLEEVLRESGWKKIEKGWLPPLLVAHGAEKIKVPALG